MLPTDLSIAQARIRDLLAEAETSRLAARLRKTGRRPARGRWRQLTGHRRQGIGGVAPSRS
jgi:hypothetical protein